VVGSAGDMNGDGIDDFVVGAPYSGGGRASLIFGASGADTLEDHDCVGTHPGGGLRFVGPSPNPARNEVELVLELDRSVPVGLTVYNLAGHEVARPIAGEWLSGRISRAWRPAGLPNGVYYVRAELGDREQIRKVVWLGDPR